ncbi:hypothetical protein ACSXCN_00270 [Clostridium perfringens]
MRKIFKITLIIVLVFLVILIAYLKAIPIDLSLKSKYLLTTFFNLQFKKGSFNTTNFINDSNLAELYNLKFNSLSENNKNKINIKLTVNINSIIRKKINSYIVKFEVIKTFNYIGLQKKSEVIDYYTCEIQNIDKRLYINKLVDDMDYNNYINTIDSNFIIKELYKYILPYDNYSDYLNIDINNRKKIKYKNKKLIFNK